MKRITLKTKFVVLLAAIIALCLAGNLAWEERSSARQTERELLQQARALSANMDAAWEFMTINQKTINYDSAGNYEFKGLQCSIAGRSIGSLFSARTDYLTRYVAERPRNDSDTPDEFEAQALAAFAADPSLEEYYEEEDVEGRRMFRYVAPMLMEASCLECHGEPAGELDEAGYEKEGLREGDLYGAISLAIPLEAYEQAADENSASDIVVSVLMMVACCLTVYLALSVLVTRPIGRLCSLMGTVERGDLSARSVRETSSAEMGDLARGFDLMVEELSNVYGCLEGQVAERTAALEQANRTLERQQRDLKELNRRLVDDNRFKSDFLSIMSHELRTPLAASMAFTGILKERRAHMTPEEERLWREVETNNQLLLALINNILGVARLDAGREELHIELVDVGDVVGMLQTTVEPLVRQKGLFMTYSIDEDVPLFAADAEKLRRIMENLVSNAMKFTPAGGCIDVSVVFDAERRRVVFSVSDTGVGIPEDQTDAVFDRFVQVKGETERSRGGSGLGLALVKGLAEMHGGSVSVCSSVGVGSTFTVEIPSDAEVQAFEDSNGLK